MFNIFDEQKKFDSYISDYIKDTVSDASTTLLITLVRKQYRLYFIDYLYRSNAVTREEAASLIIDSWSSFENISNDVNVLKKRIMFFLNTLKKLPEVERNLSTLPEVVTAYRGTRVCGVKGFSWTLKKDMAVWFSDRYNYSDAHVYVVQVPRTSIIFHLLTGEDESILNPFTLKNVVMLQ